MPKIEVEVKITPDVWAEIEAIARRKGRQPREVAGDLLRLGLKERR